VNLQVSEVTEKERKRAEGIDTRKERRNKSIISVEEGKKYYKFEAEWLLRPLEGGRLSGARNTSCREERVSVFSQAG
jgi:hypothetical protein